MVSKDVWGRTTWKLFHHMVNELKEERTDLIQPILTIIRNICRNLPCPECSEHATLLLNRLNLSSIKTKRDLVKCIHELHNKVNTRLQKRELTLEEHDLLYKYVNTQIAFIEWKRISQLRNRSNKMLLYTISKQFLINEVSRFFNQHKNAFRD